jgi:acyl-CoA thioester hydrolase
MPLTHTRSFRVRHYECDAYGHLNNANYLRYMQETAFDASAAAGYDLRRYEEMGRLWLIRESEVEYLQPLYYNDLVNVKTWVADFRRSTSRREYEFYNGSSGELAARGATNWAFLDSTSNRPARIPVEMVTAFIPESASEQHLSRQAFPQAPPPPSGVFSTIRRVIWRDIDSQQHVNNAVYLEYVEECGFQVLAAHGWPVQRMMKEGFVILVRKNQIHYRLPAFMGDELEITTWASQVRRSTAVRYYQVRRCRDRALLVEVHALGVWVDLSTGRPARIPPDFLADFQANIVSEV